MSEPRCEQSPVIPSGKHRQLYDQWIATYEGRECLEPSILGSLDLSRYLTNRIERAFFNGVCQARWWVNEDLQPNSIAFNRLCFALRAVQSSLELVSSVAATCRVAAITDETNDLIAESARRLTESLERAEALANLLAELLPADNQSTEGC